MERAAGATASAGSIRVEVLGPLRLVVDGRVVEVPGPKRRAVLALLARAQGRTVAVDDLIEAVWPSEAPDAARASLHSHLSRLRGHLGPAAARLETVRDGYRLSLPPGGLDAAHASELLARARDVAADDPATAHRLLVEARGLWRGTVLTDLRDIAPLTAWAVALDELRREIDDQLIDCALRTGRAAEAVGAAREAVAAEPLREPAVLLLMRALAATGRKAEALREGYRFRRRLAEETGLDPSPELATWERRIASEGREVPRRPVAPAATRLVGREAELAALRRLLAEGPLVTVVGPGGVGKTSLALELVRQLPEPCLLPLAPVADPATVPYALATALGMTGAQGDVTAACATLLAAGPRTLLVDNCEHLRPAVRELLSTLLARCPELTVLATSREPLGLALERQLRLGPLALPRPDAAQVSPTVPSVAVFLDRAARVRSGPEPGPDELRLVGDIVRRLDGIPLAIELAAGRLSSLSLRDLHARLDRALDLLGDGHRGDRHRTLRATIGWSYDLLPPAEQRLFRHLSVFPDGFDLATAERVAVELGLDGDPTARLARLVDASMVDAELAGEPRYRMLETLRAFGLDRLAAENEWEQARDRLLGWAVDLARGIEAAEAGEDEPWADAALRRELPNLRAAWRLARREGLLEAAVAMVTSLLLAATARDLTEVWEWSRELAGDPATARHPRRAELLGMAAAAAWLRGQPTEAYQLANEGLAVATDDRGRWWCLCAMAYAHLSTGRFAEAIDASERAAELARNPAENFGIAALAATYAGDLDRARELNARSGATAVAPNLRALHAYVAGEIANAAGDLVAAEECYRRAIELATAAGATLHQGVARVGLVTVHAAAGKVAEALDGYRELIDYWERTGMWLQQWTTLRNLARLLRELGDPEPALFLAAAADHAPDAPAVDETVWPVVSSGADDPGAADIYARAATASRVAVLQTARDAIARHLGRAGQPGSGAGPRPAAGPEPATPGPGRPAQAGHRSASPSRSRIQASTNASSRQAS